MAPAFAGEVTFLSELSVHGVSAWTTDDLVRMLQSGVGAYDLRAIFATAGIARDALDNLLWDRQHGAAKRLRVIASIVLQQAAQQQQLAEHLAARTDAPLFTIDVAMSAVDSALAQNGASDGCTRQEMQAVFDWLTNPLVRRAVWTDATKTAIVRV
ncbi:MAG TPA: hypothetical protein VFH72_04295 [Candidatus Baltobacteraceae bacterium]|nr:hypothetical protein [Candidatus Baltobacteraceae bacterium]